MKLCVIGLGKLGLSWALVLADSGFDVVGVDVNNEVCKELNKGIVSHNEPGCEELLNKHLNSKIVINNSFEILNESISTIFIVVPTPSLPDRSFSTKYAKSALRSSLRALSSRRSPVNIVLVSTVMPGACSKMLEEVYSEISDPILSNEYLHFAYNPEFIALGSVISDMKSPDFILIGSQSEKCIHDLSKIYRSVNGEEVKIAAMSTTSAEITKIAINTFLTIKISYANYIGLIASRVNESNANEILKAVGFDSRIGQKYLNPGLGFGGPCLPRDTKAFSYLSETLGLHPYLSESSDQINDIVRKQAVNSVNNFIEKFRHQNCEKIAIIGLSYKKGSWILEDSHQMSIVTEIVKAKNKIFMVFDELLDVMIENNVIPEILQQQHLRLTSSASELCDFNPDIIVSLNHQDCSKLSDYINSFQQSRIFKVTDNLYTNPEAISDNKLDSHSATRGSRKISIKQTIISNLRSWYEKHAGTSLEEIHTLLDNNQSNKLSTQATDQFSYIHGLIHKGYDTDSTFMTIYEELIKYTLLSLHSLKSQSNKQILVQAFPTVRIQFPNNISVFEFHKDAFYNHPTNEINHFLALTDSTESMSLWRETDYIQNDHSPVCEPTYRPVNLKSGELICFDTANYWHGDMPNLKGKTRMSIDFRIIFENVDLTGATTLSGKKQIKVGSYYQWFDTIQGRFI